MRRCSGAASSFRWERCRLGAAVRWCGGPTARESNATGSSEEQATEAGEAASPAPYRRRSSDPRTLRERMDFRRDHKYGRHRPLPDVPWRQRKEKTYLDDAERLYGRKETWHMVEDEVLREKLVAILQDYLRDTIAGARLEVRDAAKYKRIGERCAAEYRAAITAGAFGSPDMLQDWARSVVAARGGDRGAEAGLADGPEGRAAEGAGGPALEEGGEESAGSTLTPEQEAWRERRRARGAEADLAGTAAVSSLPDADGRSLPRSAFPFLRQRAVEGEHTLDPSLVDWTAKYFPDDDEGTFRAPPQLRRPAAGEDGNVGSSPDVSETGEGEATSSSARDDAIASRGLPRHHARHRLHRSLRAHEDRRRATFDAEGVFYHVRHQSEDDERAPRPRPVRGSEISGPDVRDGGHGSGGVVKVPWDVVAASKQQGYTPDVLRAKERLIRLSRGEDPETIP